jgi:hypothetical protein
MSAFEALKDSKFDVWSDTLSAHNHQASSLSIAHAGRTTFEQHLAHVTSLYLDLRDEVERSSNRVVVKAGALGDTLKSLALVPDYVHSLVHLQGRAASNVLEALQLVNL